MNRAVDYYLNNKLNDSEDIHIKPKVPIHVLSYHGDLNSSLRTQNLNAFRGNSQEKIHHVLVATDIAARGLDIPETNHVIMFDLPLNPTDYIHRYVCSYNVNRMYMYNIYISCIELVVLEGQVERA